MQAVAAVPDRTQQREAALAVANEVRTWRADLKRRVARGEVDVTVFLAGEVVDWRIDTMKVRELLLACPSFGRVRTDKVLHAAGVAAAKSVAGLTRRQRLDLVRGIYGQPPARRWLR